MNPYAQYENIIPLLAPVDIASTITASGYMDLKTANRASFLVAFGLVTCASADVEVLTVEAASAEGGAEAAIAFNYRKSGAVGANTWGAITAATSAGINIDPSTDDNVMIWIDIDPAAVYAAKKNARYVRVKLTDNTDMTACLVSVIGFIDPIYKQATMISATASASA